MATVVLQYAGAALGTLLGGPIGGIVGRAVGGLAGAVVDGALFGSATHREGPRLNSLSVMASQEGAAVPVVYGRMRVAGQVIWATNILEVASTSSQGGKGLGSQSTTTDYSYYANFAVSLCEGQVQGLGRCWADGKEIDLSTFSPRLYYGSESQSPDSLISAIEGADLAPAYRGLAYVVFERMPLANFGNRLPQLSFEVFSKGNDTAALVRAVNIIPGATEFGYDTALVTRSGGPGVTLSENTHVSAMRSDFSVSMDQLQQICVNVGQASLVVSWFANDLRCASTQLRPGIDDSTKVTTGATWTVSGDTRTTARAVSRVNGMPAYGGTPSDASVIHAIQDLKARELKVMFYPFVLMDIPTGNALPDPYGGAAQAAYPWRGRMTASKAQGISGTPDKTAALATEIASFVGAATPAQFVNGTDTIIFSGSEWSYRRMILHYAKLCALAGGVDAFLVGSELRGLTALRSAAGTFPFVTALQALAADVKSILPAAKISYAADWSEYFGYQPGDGTRDVYFHLDPLWSSASVDFIGIDNYFPLSDWRDGSAHLDYVAGTRSIYDRSYLQSRIAGGELYDWYYASPAARDAQTRSLISDGAYNKPWVFRPKDLKSWWSNAHFNRPGGVESASATGWVPQSKPIWFTELGCAAVDKGANQPNVFVDPKSTESALPYYSGGQTDTQMQLAFLRATMDYWNAGGSQNPTSPVYGAAMVDASRTSIWCWDARPYPAFPARSDVWGDAANYARGHWLNGRVGSLDLATVIASVVTRFGLADFDVSAVEGLVDGFVLDKPMSARDALETLLGAFAVDTVESAGQLKFTSRQRATTITLSPTDLIDDAKVSALITQHRAQETDLPVAVHLAYMESGLDYRQAAVAQWRSATSSKNEIGINLAAAIPQIQAQARADYLLADAWAARTTAQFSLPPHWEALEPGDVVVINSDRWRIKNILAGDTRKIEAVAQDVAVIDAPALVARATIATVPAIYGPPEVLAMDLALADTTGSAAPRIAAQATPWPGRLAEFKKTGAASFAFSQQINQPATIGTSLTALNAGLTGRVDFNQTLDVQLRSGAFSSIDRDALLAGGNAIALGSNSTGFEILQFQNAALIAAITYRLSGLLRAQAGSEPEMLATRLAGQTVVLLNAALAQPAMTVSEAGQGATWRIGPAQLDYGNTAYTEIAYPGGLKPLRPLMPTYLQLKKDPSGLLISWIRRTRVDGDSWELAEVPLSETIENYKLDIVKAGTLMRSVQTTQPAYLYASADILTDFGAGPISLTARVSQTSAVFGQGAILERTMNA